MDLLVNENQNRTRRVKLSFTENEFNTLNSRRGSFCLATHIRQAALSEMPPAVPQINREAWISLSKVTGNLATLATCARAGQFINESEIMSELSSLRTQLISPKVPFFSYCDNKGDQK